jgi:MFS family permease
MNKSHSVDTTYSWIRLAITLLIAAIGNVGMWAVIVVMPAVQAEFGVDRADASIPYMMTMFGFAAGNLLIGRAVDRFGITPALIGAALLTGCGYTIAAYSGSMLMLSFGQILTGLGTAVSFGPLIADISHWFHRRRGIAVAIAASGNYLSGAFWPLLLSNLLIDAGWRWVYLTLAFIVVITLVPLALLLRPRLPEAEMNAAEARTGVASASIGFSPRRLQLLLAVAGIGCCMAMSMPQVHIVSLSVDFGFGTKAGAQMLSLMLMGGVVSRITSGFIADRLGGVRTLLIGSVLQCIALFLYLPAEGLVTLYVVSFVFGLAQGGIVPSYALIVREFLPAKEAGARVGFVIMATIIGMALGGWMSGWIYVVTGSYQMAFINGILWNFLNIGIMVLVFFKSRTNKTVMA